MVSFENYNGYRTIVSTLLRRAKEIYFIDRFNDSIDYSRKTWRLLNDLVIKGRSKKKKDICEIEVGDSMIDDHAEITEHLNSNYFQLLHS